MQIKQLLKLAAVAFTAAIGVMLVFVYEVSVDSAKLSGIYETEFDNDVNDTVELRKDGEFIQKLNQGDRELQTRRGTWRFYSKAAQRPFPSCSDGNVIDVSDFIFYSTSKSDIQIQRACIHVSQTVFSVFLVVGDYIYSKKLSR